MTDFWYFAKRMLRYPLALTTGVVLAILAAAGLGIGLASLLPIMRLMLGGGQQKGLADLAIDYNATATILAIPAAIVLIAIPGIFSTRGDKKRVVVATSGPKRVRIEFALQMVALAGAWIAWPPWLAVLCTVVVGVSLFSGIPRARWLLAGARLE